MFLQVLNPILWVMFIAGPVLIYCGFRGSPHLSGPRCAHCLYDLRAHFADGRLQLQTHACPECGNDLTTPDAITFDADTRRDELIWIGSVLWGIPSLYMLYVAATADWRFLGYFF